MTADTEIQDAIKESAKGPLKATGDSVSVEQHRLPDQIAADRYVDGRTAAATPARGLRFTATVPPGGG